MIRKAHHQKTLDVKNGNGYACDASGAYALQSSRKNHKWRYEPKKKRGRGFGDENMATEKGKITASCAVEP